MGRQLSAWDDVQYDSLIHSFIQASSGISPSISRNSRGVQEV